MLSFKDIAKIFEEIEVRLCAALKRCLKKHKQLESREGFEWSAWQAEKLHALEQFRRENRAVMDDYADLIDAQTRELMQEQFAEGERLAEQETAQTQQQISEAPPVSSSGSVHFFGVNEAKMESLMQDITELEQRAETAALRTMDDVYRQTLNRVQLAQAVGEMPLEKAIDEAMRDFLEQGIKCIVYRDGRRVNIADYVRMALRTTSARAALQGRAKRFAELGYDTVLISQYSACSKTCEPWQGRVYIDDVFTVWQGESDGVRGKSNYCGEWFTLLSHAISGGLFHPNCRHTMGQYIHGVTQPPEPIPAEQIKRERELEQKQRAMERNIRRLKRLEAGTLDPAAAKEYRRKLNAAERELGEFVNANRDVLRREFEREKAYTDNVSKKIYVEGDFASAKEIPEDIKSEIVNSIEEIQSTYNVHIDEFVYEDISEEYGKAPFQFQPINSNGTFKSCFVINKGFNWEENLDKLNERIYNRNYSKGILASKNTRDLIAHEMAHFMSFQDCKSYDDFIRKERELRTKFIAGVSGYSDILEDGSETIAEGFVRIRNNEKVDERVKALVDEYVERWRK